MPPEPDGQTNGNERGAALVEYGLLAAVLALALSFVATQFTTVAQTDLTPRGSLVGNPDNLTPTN